MSDNVSSSASVPCLENTGQAIDRPTNRWFAKIVREAGYAAQKLPVDLAVNVMVLTLTLPLMWVEAGAIYLLKKTDPAFEGLDDLSKRIGERRKQARQLDRKNG